ncbi:MAG: acyl-CoA/acyl-ACP dehydrogenase [Actinobacteria bacterium]|nr:acyl-CoA/acyl-ACP dehydrogenase [Actinomycetota bacterium]
MDFTLSDEQAAVQETARAVFTGRGSWRDLATANLLGIALPDDVGGSGLGMVELALILEEQGRVVAPLPVWPTLVAALAVDRFDIDRATWLPRVIAGDAVLSIVDGAAPVPYAVQADALLVGRSLVAPGPVEVVETTDGQPAGLVAHAAELDPWVRDRVLVALCALQAGVCEAALRQTAAYVSEREQFGRPIATFQAVAQRAADAYIDVQAMRVTMLAAAWQLDNGGDNGGDDGSAAADVRVAKWWAAEGGHRVIHACQHLHGGIGSDLDYPIHRYFLWGKQLVVMLGAGSEQLAALANLVAV